MADKTNTQDRIKKAEELKQSLEEKLEVVRGSPREEEFRLQIEKLEGLIAPLTDELED